MTLEVSSREAFRTLRQSNLTGWQQGVAHLRQIENDLKDKIQQVVDGKLTVGFVGDEETGNIHGLSFATADKPQAPKSILGQLNVARNTFIDQLFQQAVPEAEKAKEYLQAKYNKAQELCLFPPRLERVLKKIEDGVEMKTDADKASKSPKVAAPAPTPPVVITQPLTIALEAFAKKGAAIQPELNAVARGEKILELSRDEALSLDQRIKFRKKAVQEFTQDNSDVKDLLQKIRLLALKEALRNAGVSDEEIPKVIKLLNVKELLDSRFVPPDLQTLLMKHGNVKQAAEAATAPTAASVKSTGSPAPAAASSASPEPTAKVQPNASTSTPEHTTAKDSSSIKPAEPPKSEESPILSFLLAPFRAFWNWLKKLFGIQEKA